MFRHRGKTRTLKHNLQIASLLSFVAGVVNVAGFLAVQRLTTNVTGHFAFFVDEIFKFNFWQATIYFFFIFFFFLGSFFSNLLIEIISRKNKQLTYTIPVLLECIILFTIGYWGHYLVKSNPNTISFCLLFAMGLQNSFVTTISNANVRTTHLTGLFTDLGIELSQLFFYKTTEQRFRLISSIKLRLTIISLFFVGGIFGGIFYSNIGLHSLIAASAILLVGIIYDGVRLKLILLKRRFKTIE